MKGLLVKYVKTALSISLLSFVLSSNAVELGNAIISSKVTEPLSIHIPIQNVGEIALSDLRIEQPTQALYESFGINYADYPGDIEYQLREGYDKNYWIFIQTDWAVNTPYFIYLVRLVWPDGQLIKEQIALLDGGVEQPVSYMPLDTMNLEGGASPSKVVSSSMNSEAESYADPIVNNDVNLAAVDGATNELQMPLASTESLTHSLNDIKSGHELHVGDTLGQGANVGSYMLFSGIGEPLSVYIPISFTNVEINDENFVVDVQSEANRMKMQFLVHIKSQNKALIEVYTNEPINEPIDLSLQLKIQLKGINQEVTKNINKHLIIELQ